MKKVILVLLSIILFYYLFFKEKDKIELITNEKRHSDKDIEKIYNLEETSNHAIEKKSNGEKESPIINKDLNEKYTDELNIDQEKNNNEVMIENIESFDLVSDTDIFKGYEDFTPVSYVKFNHNMLFSLKKGDVFQLPLINGNQYNAIFQEKITFSGDLLLFEEDRIDFKGNLIYHNDFFPIYISYYPKDKTVEIDIHTPSDMYEILIVDGRGAVYSMNRNRAYIDENNDIPQVKSDILMDSK